MDNLLSAFKDTVINGVELYSVSRSAMEVYLNEAKQDANLSYKNLEMKLTAIKMVADEISEISPNKFNYRFGGFLMTVNEKTRKIETIHWLRYDTHISYVSDKKRKKLKEIYFQMGLSLRGKIKCVA